MNVLKMMIIAVAVVINATAGDLYEIDRETLKGGARDLPQPKLSITQTINSAGEFVLQTIEEGKNIIREITISNPVRELTIMVFINGKNDLEKAGLININDMERIGSNKDVNIIVEFGRMSGQIGDTREDGDWVGVRRYYIKKDNDTSKITSPIVYSKTGPKRYDMGDFKKVVEFVNWTKKKFPARRYMLILWDHGTGWLDPRKNIKKSQNVSKGISFDDETGNYITTEEIGNIVKLVGGVDILAFDACLMQMAEVLAEVRGYTKVVIGSEEVVPGLGYPYALFLDPITKNPYMSNEEIAKTVVKSFEIFYHYFKIPAALSAVRSHKVKGLLTAMSEFAKAAMDADEKEALKKARDEVIRFDILGEVDDPNKKISFFADIYDFARIVKENIKNNNEKSNILREKSQKLMRYITDELVIAVGSYGDERTGKPLSIAKGVSVYIPPVSKSVKYESIDRILNSPYSSFRFAKETEWDKFVRFLYENAK